MWPYLFSTSLLLFVVFRFIGLPVWRYFRDVKGLRRYPNMSAFSGITDLAFMAEARRGFRSRRLAELHKTEPVIRIGPNSLSYGDHRAVKDIYGHGTPCIKDDFYDILSGSHFHLADCIDKPQHAQKRKGLSQAYSLKNLETWEHKVADKVIRMIRQFDTRCAPESQKDMLLPDTDSSPVDFSMWANYFTMDAIIDIGLSQRLGCLDRGNDFTTSEELGGKTHTSHWVWSYKWFRTFERVIPLVSKKYRNLFHNGSFFDGIVHHQASSRLKTYLAGERSPDFFEALMESKDCQPRNLEWGEIFAEISIMLNAGSASTSFAITNALYMLIKHPQVLQKLRQELESVLDEDDVAVPYDKVKHLPYLRACLDESMRVVPPTTFGLPRKTPPEGTTIMGQYVAGGTTVSMSAYVAHRDEKVFAEPEVFRPERWLEEGGKDMQAYFITFSAGARGCIGRNISYLEQTCLIASLVHRYDFALPSPDWEQAWFEHLNLIPGPMPIKMRRRQLTGMGDES